MKFVLDAFQNYSQPPSFETSFPKYKFHVHYLIYISVLIHHKENVIDYLNILTKVYLIERKNVDDIRRESQKPENLPLLTEITITLLM